MTGRDEGVSSNRALWDEWTGIHETSEFYDLQTFKQGGIRLREYEIQEVGSVTGKDLLHLQCHFGMDTVSWARLGAKVTGADFSERAVELARSLAAGLGIDARFVCSEIYALPEVLDGTFDVVYTSRGVLGWLPELEPWARVIAHFLRPGGIFYITEIHPVALVFDDTKETTGLEMRFPYFPRGEPITLPVKGSYADPSADVSTRFEYTWPHSMAEIVSSLAFAGLHIDFLHERPWLEWQASFLVPRGDGTWALPPDQRGEVPLSFALRATKTGA